MFRRILIILCVMCLTGCASFPFDGKPAVYKVEPPALRQAQLEKIQFWRIYGAFSIRQSNRSAEIADFNWYEFNRGYRISITSALDLYRISIFRQFNSVTLWKNGTEVSEAKTPEGLMEKAMGWSLPLHQLIVWIKAMPDENAGPFKASYDEFGHLTKLVQAGWTIYYAKFKPTDNDIDLPHGVMLIRGNLEADIAIKHWDITTYREPTPKMMP